MRPKIRETRRERSARLTESPRPPDPGLAAEPPREPRYLTLIGVALILVCTFIIYGQTIRVPAIDYEDTFYLVRSAYVHVSPAFSRLDAVWTEPYFANFHPVTTTSWLVDRALADRSLPFDSLPFRITHLFYAAVGASLALLLYRRLGIPAMLAALGAVVYAVHPIHTEVIAWLSARKDLISLIFILLSLQAWLWARGATTALEWRLRYPAAIVLALLAVLSKPIAVILPPLFVAYEFCSAPHTSLFSGNWRAIIRDPLLRRTLMLTAIFLVVGGASTAVFRPLLARDTTHGGWLIFVPVALLLVMSAIAPAPADMAGFCAGRSSGTRVIGPPFAVLSVVFGAGSAWTFWAQQQVGAIKGSAAPSRTLNLTLDAMLSYAGKALLPFHMSASYTWSDYPNLSVRGLLGAILICSIVWIALRLSGSEDRNRRLIAFGIFWYLIALLPVSNLVATSTKMADRYLFVPTVGSTLVLLGLVAPLFSASRHNRAAVVSALLLVVAGYTAWSYHRTEVWCGKTTKWNDVPQPDLSLWTAAVEVNPDDTLALTNLGLAYLRLIPPQAEKALEHLNHALQVGKTNQSKVEGVGQIDLAPVYEGLADAYFARASDLVAGQMDSESWRQKKSAFGNAAEFYRLALQTPSGFASDEARALSRLAESDEGQAVLDAQQLAAAPPPSPDLLRQERDALRRESDNSMQRARELLVAGNVSSLDANYRMVVLDLGNIIFGREVGATDEEKSRYYQEALRRYQEAAQLLPDDPRPLLYQGLCYERLTAIAKTSEERQRQFALGEAILRHTLTMTLDSPDYSQALPYRALAVLYTHVNDYRSALDALKKAQQANPSAADRANLERDIRTLEEYLAGQRVKK